MFVYNNAFQQWISLEYVQVQTFAIAVSASVNNDAYLTKTMHVSLILSRAKCTLKSLMRMHANQRSCLYEQNIVYNMFLQFIFGRDFLSPHTTIFSGIENYHSTSMSCCSDYLAQLLL